MAIDIAQEIEGAEARLPVKIDQPLPVALALRTTALMVAQRHVGDTCVKEGGLYQQLKMDNKLGNDVSIDDVLRAALVFERYLWGEWSKGIAENAMAAIETQVADAIEEEFKKRMDGGDDDPTHPSSASA